MHPRASKPRKRPSLCENSDVELARRNFVSITLNMKRTALAVERGKGRKQFCAFSARARFHTGWTRIGHCAAGPLRLATVDKHAKRSVHLLNLNNRRNGPPR